MYFSSSVSLKDLPISISLSYLWLSLARRMSSGKTECSQLTAFSIVCFIYSVIKVYNSALNWSFSHGVSPLGPTVFLNFSTANLRITFFNLSLRSLYLGLLLNSMINFSFFLSLTSLCWAAERIVVACLPLGLSLFSPSSAKVLVYSCPISSITT